MNEMGRPPDGHTKTGTPYWLARRFKDDDARIFGPWPTWPDEEDINPSSNGATEP